MATEGTWLCTGTVQVITIASEVLPQAHAELARQVYAALADIPPLVAAGYSFHGIDIGSMTPTDDDTQQAHADVISFTAGAGG